MKKLFVIVAMMLATTMSAFADGIEIREINMNVQKLANTLCVSNNAQINLMYDAFDRLNVELDAVRNELNAKRQTKMFKQTIDNNMFLMKNALTLTLYKKYLLILNTSLRNLDMQKIYFQSK